jgi:hypothetical protein
LGFAVTDSNVESTAKALCEVDGFGFRAEPRSRSEISAFLENHIERLGDKRCRYREAGMTDEKMAGVAAGALGYHISRSTIRKIRVADFGQMRNRHVRSRQRDAEVDRLQAEIERLRYVDDSNRSLANQMRERKAADAEMLQMAQEVRSNNERLLQAIIKRLES